MDQVRPVRLVQYREQGGSRAALVVDERTLRPLRAATVYELAWRAIADGVPLAEAARAAAGDETVDYEAIVHERRLLAPLTHADEARCLVSGTGLTHLGSAAARQRMHEAKDEDLTDSMRMFRMGLEGGKPPAGAAGAQPEWFYKGDGSCVRAPEQPVEMPAFAMDGGDEAEIVGLYLIAPDGSPRRLGFALGNEFSDHAMERVNYLWLAQSKIRACSFGPELLVGALPDAVAGRARILRDGREAWRGGFSSGEANMSHAIANLEHHHFKHALFRRPGDAHVHYFGAAALSCSDGFATREGDEFEIAVPLFGRPLRNRLMRREPEQVAVQAL
jgi:hypothetical protein